MVKHTKARRTRGRRIRGGNTEQTGNQSGMDDGAAADTTMSAPEQPGLLANLKASKLNPMNWFGTPQTAGRHTRRHQTGRKGRKGSKSRRV
jgi:hypothetical protein